MKRWTLRIFVFLLLVGGGAIVNVAVAWGLVVVERNLRSVVLKPDLGMLVEAGWAPPEQRNSTYRVSTEGLEAVGLRWRVHSEHQSFPDHQPKYVKASTLIVGGILGWDVLAGWPLYSLTGVVFDETAPSWRANGDRSPRYWMLGETDPLLPLRPVWPGFAINTVFYAAILWMIFFMPFALRRRRRLKRGLCANCAYDLRAMPADSNACPECGTQLPSPSR